MFSSVKGRIVVGFGIVMLLLVVATIVNVTLVSGISTDFDRFRSALSRKSQAVETDLVMTKVRVRVNQWLRSVSKMDSICGGRFEIELSNAMWHLGVAVEMQTSVIVPNQ